MDKKVGYRNSALNPFYQGLSNMIFFKLVYFLLFEASPKMLQMSQKIENSTRQRYVLDSTALYNTRQSSLTKNDSGGFLHRSEDLISPRHEDKASCRKLEGPEVSHHSSKNLKLPHY
jgi:hypothetical protein